MSTLRLHPPLLRRPARPARLLSSLPATRFLKFRRRRSGFLSPGGLYSSRPASITPVVRATLTESTSLAGAAEDAEVLLSETFSLKRTELVEGVVSVRLEAAEGEDFKRRLKLRCNLEGNWILHWGVTYCDDLGSEWDQPPPEMRPPGSIPVKDYAVETPLKRCPSAIEGIVFHEVQIDIASSSQIAAVNFVLKEEETGAWFQHKGRDFRIPLMGQLDEDCNITAGKQGLGALGQLSSLLLKPAGSDSKFKETGVELKNTKDNMHLEGFYEEYSIAKENCAQSFITVVVKKSTETDKNLLEFDTDIPGDVVVHWGVCRDKDKKWEIPAAPHPPSSKKIRQKALQTLLQPKPNGSGNWGLFMVDKDISGVLFVLKLNENTWLNNKGTDFYVPLESVSSLTTQASRDQTIEKSDAISPNSRISDISIVKEVKSSSHGEPKSVGEAEQVAGQAGYTDEIINEIRNLVTDISSEKSKRRKSKEVRESILQEIEKLAAEAYSIFRSASVNFVEESVVDADQLKATIAISSGTGTGYEILCQGFNWESHKSGRWYSELNAKASELSSMGFTIIWLPPPTESVSPEGYMPKDLYNLNSRLNLTMWEGDGVPSKNHNWHSLNITMSEGTMVLLFLRSANRFYNCRYGSMEELKGVVKRFHEAGIKVLGDVVLNHRCAHFQNRNGIWNMFGGRLNWDDRAIVADDPHFQGRGNKSSGDNFHAAPNIDHSQDFVRKDIKEWLCWLRKEIGYDGWRLDFVRGFWGGYVKDYLEATEPYFAVGEYWDSLCYTYGAMDHNQDAHRQRIVDWINATNGTAGAFDVTTKGILHSALEKCEYWRLSDQKGKPPGVLGWWPSRAVTFIENHDTGSTQGHWRFPAGKEMQGYAYILTHPGTPAVFYDHIFSHYKQEISKLISLRHRTKVHCRSMVKIIKAEKDVYAAEIDEKITVKIGPGHYEPSNDSQKWVLAAEGKDYKVWEAS